VKWLIKNRQDKFDDCYSKNNWLHGLALIGVRAVLGVDSERGSPFNIQRSLHVLNFTLDEVTDLFGFFLTGTRLIWFG
jgi:hypothetical protein